MQSEEADEQAQASLELHLLWIRSTSLLGCPICRATEDLFHCKTIARDFFLLSGDAAAVGIENDVSHLVQQDICKRKQRHVFRDKVFGRDAWILMLFSLKNLRKNRNRCRPWSPLIHCARQQLPCGQSKLT